MRYTASESEMRDQILPLLGMDWLNEIHYEVQADLELIILLPQIQAPETCFWVLLLFVFLPS